MIMWNELSYESQKKIMELIEDLLLKQTDIELQDGLVAALIELEIWSNSPIIEEPYIAQAVDQHAEDDK